MRFTQLKVKGYRSLVDVTLPLSGLNVLIGPNGCGKTSVLEVFQLLHDAMQGDLTASLDRLGGVSALLSRVEGGPDRLQIELLVDVESERSREPMCYRFELQPREVGYVIPFERLEWRWDPHAERPFRYIEAHYDRVLYSDPDTISMISPTWAYDPLDLALAQVPRTYQEPEALRTALTRTRMFSFLDVGPRAVVRLPQALTPTTRPGPNGENLYSTLYNLRALHPETYTRLEEVLALGFPGFHRLEFPVVGAGQVTLAWYQRDLAGPLYPGELSEGTLRFLWLATVLLSPQPTPITLIDEPEVSLHPELIKLLVGLLQDAATRGQFIVATHSSDLVRWLRPDEVVVLDKEEGRTTLARADALDLDEWLREYTLSELWLMGTLGGRP